MFLNKAFACALVVCLCLSASLQAAIVSSGTTMLPMFPIQDLILPANSPFNPTSMDVLADDVTAFGTTVFTRQTQVGTTIELTNGNFFGTGSHALLGSFEIFAGAQYGLTPMTATLSNVLQDPNHPGFALGDPASIIFADAQFVVPNYGVRLIDLNVNLEVRDSFFFTASFDGLPPSPGTVYTAQPFTGASSLLPAYIAGTQTVVGFSTERRLIAAVPEPSALGAIAVMLLPWVTRRRRNRKSTLAACATSTAVSVRWRS